MNGREAGFLLLTSHLGNPERKVLTVAQLRKLAQRVSLSKRMPADREMIPEDLLQLGYSRQEAERILNLLSQTEQLSWYVQKGERKGCRPITRVSECYPLQLRKRLGLDSPGCLWAKGDLSLLQTPMIALVGSRDLRRENLEFAREVGKQAALQGITLVSGNARGADQEGQSACLEHGGSVISVVADELEKQPAHDRVLYLSEEGFDLPFSPQRALSRNRVIHCLGRIVLIAQCTYGKGGTWDGTLKNLQNSWSGVSCFQDGSPAVTELIQRGAQPIDMDDLRVLEELKTPENLFDQ